jgi:hypothetical protein
VRERTEKSFEFDFAVSYASPDAEFVSEVVQSMKGRGLRVFFAPDEQAEIIGRNLIDFLTEVYLIALCSFRGTTLRGSFQTASNAGCSGEGHRAERALHYTCSDRRYGDPGHHAVRCLCA